MSARAGRGDFDAMLKISAVPANEPVFLLRAQDVSGAAAVRAWAALSKDAGVPVAVIEQALRQADAMDGWAVKKTPDADHLGESEQKRLAYAFARRAWYARAETPDAAIALAERRGYDEAAAVIRPLLDALKEASKSVERDREQTRTGGVFQHKGRHEELGALQARIAAAVVAAERHVG